MAGGGLDFAFKSMVFRRQFVVICNQVDPTGAIGPTMGWLFWGYPLNATLEHRHICPGT